LGPDGRAAVIFLFWLLTLTRVPVSLGKMVSEPASPLLAVGSKRACIDYFFILAADVDAWASHYFFK
jgi:hypothetical protein